MFKLYVSLCCFLTSNFTSLRLSFNVFVTMLTFRIKIHLVWVRKKKCFRLFWQHNDYCRGSDVWLKTPGYVSKNYGIMDVDIKCPVVSQMLKCSLEQWSQKP